MREAGGYRGSRSQGKELARARKELARRRAAAAPGKRNLRRSLSSAGVMTVVAGLFLSLTLPAFAEQQSYTRDSTGDVAGQSYEVAASSTELTHRDAESYTTTSAAEMRKLYAEAIMQQNLAAYLASGARQLGDDYPWPANLTRSQGGGLSPLRYYYRECVDFVAWRINRDAGSFSAPFKYDWGNLASGSAYAWKREWESHGWPVSSVPIPGAVAWFPGANHVAYVSGILGDGSVAIEEYNGMVKHGYAQRVIQPGDAVYLYPPPR
jgi:surface antigen